MQENNSLFSGGLVFKIWRLETFRSNKFMTDQDTLKMTNN